MEARRHVAVLFVEDSESDLKLSVRELQRAGFEISWERVEEAGSLRTALQRRSWDIVVSDSSMPGLGVFEALSITRSLAPTTPFLVVSGTLREDTAVEILRAGASDFITKHNIRRLVPAIARELARPPLSPESPQVARLLVVAQEAQARRIAGELHARIGQLLVALAHTLGQTEQTGELAPTHVAAARALLEQTLQRTRELSTELWPSVLDELGLASALRWLGDRYASRLGYAVVVEASGLDALPAAIAAACFRIAEEALANIARHAAASSASITLRDAGGSIELSVRDDGRGFDPALAWRRAVEGDSLGLLAMRERATVAGGTLAIESAPGTGTTVRAHVPVRPS